MDLNGYDVLKLVLVAIGGYLLGSANSSLIVGKFYGVDVRKHGSGNAGATNTLRTLGKSAALIATIGDMLKGFIACIIGFYIMGSYGELGIMTGGVAAIVGHNWPVYFGFKGGKGILTTLAVVLMMDWKIALVLLCIFIIIVAITRYVSLGSVVSSVLFPIAGFAFEKTGVFICFAAFLGILAVIRHRSNIARILNGTESKLGKKKA